MHPSEPTPSPRRELQGPRPSPLKVSKDSHRIKKPSVAPDRSHPHAPQPQPHPQPPPSRPRGDRSPVVIYAVSPRTIHVERNDFMTLVQRLTGSNSSSSSSSAAGDVVVSPTGALSPAARIAAFERSGAAPGAREQAQADVLEQLGMEGEATLDRGAPCPGILSPVPWALPPVSPALFSPSFDPSVLTILQELSPAFGRDANSLTTTSPSTYNLLMSSPIVPSPGACWELLNQFPD